MFYLSLGFAVVWVCYFSYVYVVDRQVRQLRRQLDARDAAGTGAVSQSP